MLRRSQLNCDQIILRIIYLTITNKCKQLYFVWQVLQYPLNDFKTRAGTSRQPVFPVKSGSLKVTVLAHRVSAYCHAVCCPCVVSCCLCVVLVVASRCSCRCPYVEIRCQGMLMDVSRRRWETRRWETRRSETRRSETRRWETRRWETRHSWN